MSIVEERAALESLVLNSKQTIDSRLDILCSQPNPIEDILLVLSALYSRKECDINAYTSSLRLLLEKRAASLIERTRILKELVKSCQADYSGNVILHPVISALIADHSLLPILTSILAHIDKQPQLMIVAGFLFSLDADSFFPDALVSWTRGCIAKTFPGMVKAYLKTAIDNGSLSLMTAQSLISFIPDDLINGCMYALTVSQQPLAPLTPTKVDHYLLATVLLCSLHGDFADHLLLTRSINETTLSFDAVVFLSSIILSVRFPNDQRIVINPERLEFDSKHTIQQLKKLMPTSYILLDLFNILNGQQFNQINTESSLMIEVAIRCLVYSISGKRSNTKQCITQLVSFSAIHQTISHSIVSICETLMSKFPDLAETIMSTLSSHSRSLPVLTFLLKKMKSAFSENDLEVFFKLALKLLDEPAVRQSTLDVIAGKLRDSSFNSPIHISYSLEVWSKLACLHYISPDCIYKDIVIRNQWPQSNDPSVTIAVITFCSTMSELTTIDPETNTMNYDPVVYEALDIILPHLSYEHKYLELKSTKKKGVIEAVFSCLSKFKKTPELIMSFLSEKGIKFDTLLYVLQKYDCSVPTEPIVTVLSWYLTDDIQKMPRSLLLGTFDGRVHVPHVVGGLFSALLSIPPINDIPMANFEPLPWFLKMDFVDALATYFKNSLLESSVEHIQSQLDSLDNKPSKESILLYCLSMAACKELTPNMASIDKFRAVLNEDVQFASNCVGPRLTSVSTLSEAMALALNYGSGPTAQSSLSNKLLLPFAYCGVSSELKGFPSVNCDDLLSDDDYYSYLLKLILLSNKNPDLANLDLKATSKKSVNMSLKEPLDMQGSIAFFTSRLLKQPPDLSVSLHAMPVVKQVQYCASLLPVNEHVESLDKLISAGGKTKKLVPFVDKLVYEKYNNKNKNDNSELCNSLDRFPDSSIFKQLVKSKYCLAVLSKMPSIIPIIDWRGLLDQEDPFFAKFLLNHIHSEAGSFKRINQSVCFLIVELFRNNSHLWHNQDTDLVELLGMLPNEVRLECLEYVYSWKSPTPIIAQILKYVPLEHQSKLLKEFDALDASDPLLSILNQLCVQSSVTDSGWRQAVEIYRAYLNNSLIDHINSTDCSGYACLLSVLVPPDSIPRIASKKLRELLK